jgi:hypothetical protein
VIVAVEVLVNVVPNETEEIASSITVSKLSLGRVRKGVIVPVDERDPGPDWILHKHVIPSDPKFPGTEAPNKLPEIGMTSGEPVDKSPPAYAEINRTVVSATTVAPSWTTVTWKP